MQGNGEGKRIPAIMVGWDQETQSVQVQFEAQEFKTWEFIIAVLGMAVQHAEQKKRLAQMQQIQQQQAQAAQDQALQRHILRGK